MTHIINAGEWLLGPIDRVVADADHQLLEGVDVEDTVHVLTRHGSAMGCFTLNQYQAPNELTVTVICENGTARFEGHKHRWSWMVEPSGKWEREVYNVEGRDPLFVLQANAFLDALDGRADPPCSLAEGIQTLRVNRAILRCIDNPNMLQPIKRGS